MAVWSRVRHMKKWLRIANYMRWRFARSPVSLDGKTWELSFALTYAGLGRGEWLLRRALALPASTRMIFIGARVRIPVGRLADLFHTDLDSPSRWRARMSPRPGALC